MIDPTLPHEPHDAPLDRRLDLLVDGQLGEAERRALLRSLEKQPEAWRRCALAFLEAQCWQEALGLGAGGAQAEVVVQAQGISQAGEVAGVGELAQPGKVSGPGSAARARWWHRALTGWPGTLLALAACFLVALGLGMGLREWWLGAPGPALPMGPVPLPEGMVAAGPGGAAQAPAGPGSSVPSAGAASAAGGAGPMRWVTLCVPSGPDGDQIAVQVPALEQDELDASFWESGLALPPQEVIDSLRRQGIELRQRREMVPLRMPDGGQLVLPVEEVQFHYVGAPAL